MVKIIPKKYIIFALFLCVFLLMTINNYIDESKFSSKTASQSKKSDYCIFIEIEDNILYLLQDGNCIRKYPISSGVPGLPSPLGYWKIVSKGDWGEGFGGRWMGLNVPWGTLILDVF